MNRERELRAGSEQNNIKPIEIVSQDGEIILRQFVSEDAREVFDLIDRNRVHLSNFGEDTAEKYKTYESVLDSIENPKNPDKLRFGIRNKQGEFMGSINLTPQAGFGQGEVGYYIGAEFGGKGFTTKALEILTDYAFEYLGYETLFGVVAKGNNASVRVLEKAGYKITKEYLDEKGKEVIELFKTKPDITP